MSNHSERQASGKSAKGFRGVAENIGLVAAPLTIITALMFWIGWVRTDIVFAHFGLHSRLVDLSNQDYIQRSVDGLFDPLATLVGAGIVAYWANAAVRDRLVRGQRRHIVLGLIVAMFVLGLAGMAVGVVMLPAPGDPPDLTALLSPILLGSGLLMVVYGRWLAQCERRMRLDRFKPASWSRVELTLVSLLLVLCAFWAATEYTRAVGRGEAAQFAAEIAKSPGVVLYSDQRLYLLGPTKAVPFEESLAVRPQEQQQFHYRYSGLRLFFESKDRLFLVPADWHTGSPTFMVTNGPGIRVDFLPASDA